MNQTKSLSTSMKTLTVIGTMLWPPLIYLLMVNSQIYLKGILGVICVGCTIFVLWVLFDMLKKDSLAFGQILIIGGSFIWLPVIVMKYMLGMELKPYIMLFLIPHLLCMFLGVYYKRIKPRLAKKS
jgi:predicted permease